MIQVILGQKLFYMCIGIYTCIVLKRELTTLMIIKRRINTIKNDVSFTTNYSTKKESISLNYGRDSDWEELG